MAYSGTVIDTQHPFNNEKPAASRIRSIGKGDFR